jgi:GTP-binding protein Era
MAKPRARRDASEDNRPVGLEEAVLDEEAYEGELDEDFDEEYEDEGDDDEEEEYEGDGEDEEDDPPAGAVLTLADWQPEALPAGHRAGFVAVVGRPNVGKSSLMNAFLGEKIAIVSPKPQTTRNRLLGILTRPEAQIIFVDTPGIHQPRHKLGAFMVETAAGAIPDADVVLFVADLTDDPQGGDVATARLVAQRAGAPAILALNKADAIGPAVLQRRVDAYRALGSFADWMLVSATRGDNLDKLLDMVIARLPEGPRYYPSDQVTDQHERFMVAELIREQVLLQTSQEVPHGVAVMVEEFKERRPGLVYIGATIHVERETHKGIIIGSKGERLKQIGQRARGDIEDLLGQKVYLELWVRVRKNWREDERQLRDLGYVELE